ncbi:MAG: SM-20-related protein [Sphingomonadales bacterium]|nr:SM-20-related protein [Sphingomonadales bacterium]MEA3034618.1 SM-20-related protein [Sphingomonadales bacterium]
MIHAERFLDEAAAGALHDALSREPWQLSTLRVGGFRFRFHRRAIGEGDPSIFGAVRARLAGFFNAPIEAHASWYGPGCFLSSHNDADPEGARERAWVLHMTHSWREEWGGVLRFASGETVVPRFNMLTLFDVPREHEVTRVANDAPAGRYALAGWLARG